MHINRLFSRRAVSCIGYLMSTGLLCATTLLAPAAMADDMSYPRSGAVQLALLSVDGHRADTRHDRSNARQRMVDGEAGGNGGDAGGNGGEAGGNGGEAGGNGGGNGGGGENGAGGNGGNGGGGENGAGGNGGNGGGNGGGENGAGGNGGGNGAIGPGRATSHSAEPAARGGSDRYDPAICNMWNGQSC